MLMNNALTIIIPTYKRPHFLKRILNYYHGVKHPIIVADSSPSPSKAPNKNTSNLRYLHTPELNPFIKVRQALKHVQTPYVVLCADDDFISQSGLQEATNFLEQNKDYDSVQGHMISFGHYPTTIEWEVACPYGINYSIEQSRAYDRVLYSMTNYMNIWYSVRKTGITQKFFDLSIDQISTFNVALTEILSSIFFAAHGKHKCLPIFWTARQRLENGQLSPWNEVSDILKDIKSILDIENFISIGITILEDILKLSKKRITTFLYFCLYNFKLAKIPECNELFSTSGLPYQDEVAKKELRKIIECVTQFDCLTDNTNYVFDWTELGNSKILLYGTGNFSKIACKELERQENVTIQNIVDRNQTEKKSFMDIAVIKESELVDCENQTMVIASTMKHEIEKRLRHLKFKEIKVLHPTLAIDLPLVRSEQLSHAIST
jgi:glycosyltransferase domain-containing protein